jgi:hypothetical protein
MRFLKSFRLASATRRLDEEVLYEFVVNELAQGIRREGLWAKALVETEGDDQAANARYIKLRVQALIDEHTLAVAVARAHAESKERSQEGVEPPIKRAKVFGITREEETIELLAEAGYTVSRRSDGWRVQEPLGGRVDLDSDDALIDYAKGRVKVPD